MEKAHGNIKSMSLNGWMGEKVKNAIHCCFHLHTGKLNKVVFLIYVSQNTLDIFRVAHHKLLY